MGSGSQNLEALYDSMKSLLGQRAGVINELKRCNQKRRELRAELKRVSDTIKSERYALDKYFDQSEASKKLRKDILAKIREVRTKVDSTGQMLSKFEKAAPKLSGDILQKKLKEFEWKLQVERLTREEEKQLVQHIKELEIKLKLWKQAYSARTEMSKLLSEANELKANLDELTALRQNMRPEVEQKKNNLDLLMKTREQLREEMNGTLTDIKELEENLHRLDAELSSLEEKRSQMLKDTREFSRRMDRERQTQAIQQMKSQVQEKLARGEKVTFDQLKLVFSDEHSESLK
ncbi:MAG: hypothetical protein HYU39_02450 [Thaumarchaeota archaeon]|nr:hypothetical protein [Nitrososphaerota archaeon]